MPRPRSLPQRLLFPCRVGYLFMRISPKRERQEGHGGSGSSEKGRKGECFAVIVPFGQDRRHVARGCGHLRRARTHAMNTAFKGKAPLSPPLPPRFFHNPAPRISREWGEGRGQLPSNSRSSNSFRDSSNGSPQNFLRWW